MVHMKKMEVTKRRIPRSGTFSGGEDYVNYESQDNSDYKGL